jgi:SAM-dependent methyltransferase
MATLGTVGAAAVTIGVVALSATGLIFSEPGKAAGRRMALAALAATITCAVTLPRDYYERFGVGAYQITRTIEGRNGVATVVPTPNFYTIVDMNRTASASALVKDPNPENAYQAWRWNHSDLFALDPSFRPKRVLMIGIGHGYLAQSLLDFDFIEEIVIVDLSAEVVDAVRDATETDARAIFTDPRVRVVIGDGRRFVQRALAQGERYDLIQTKINEPWHAGSGNLFTVEFMQLQRRLLAPGGYLSVRPLAGHLVDGLAAFPVAIVSGAPGEFYHVYFRNGSLPAPTRAVITPDIAQAWVRELPGRLTPVSPRSDTLSFAYFAADPLAGAIAHNTDDHPTMEYYWLRQTLGDWDNPRRSISEIASDTHQQSVPVIYRTADQ